MGEAEDRILQMLQDGVINAEEANNLLAALRPADRADVVAGDPVLIRGIPNNEDMVEEKAPPPPDLDRFRRIWRWPFFIALGGLLLAGLGLVALYQAENPALLGFMCFWSFFLAALLVVLLALWARQAFWVHVRIQEKQGRRIAISLPVPLRFMSWGMRIGRGFVSEDHAMHLETAASLVQAMRDDPDGQPFFIDVDDDDGDKVQIYVG